MFVNTLYMEFCVIVCIILIIEVFIMGGWIPSSGSAREGVCDAILDSRDVHHPEPEGQCLRSPVE